AVARRHLALDLDRARQRLDRSRELAEHAVAGGAHDASAAPRDRRIGDVRADLAQPRMRAFLVALHHAAVAAYVRNHDRREAANRLRRRDGRARFHGSGAAIAKDGGRRIIAATARFVPDRVVAAEYRVA